MTVTAYELLKQKAIEPIRDTEFHKNVVIYPHKRFKPIIRWNTAVLSCKRRQRLQSRAGDLMKVKRKASWERQLLAAVIYFLEFHVARRWSPDSTLIEITRPLQIAKHLHNVLTVCT